MIVRILTEGQYRLPSAALDRINDLDDKLVEAIAANDEDAFHRHLHEMVSLVRAKGKLLGPEEIVESHMVLPAPDTTPSEARHLFQVKIV